MHYPASNEAAFGPARVARRADALGQDFEGRDGWRMYRRDVVPGFPQHPHRGFETVTIARRGFIDHSDSLGATARFGGGDVQWLTAGKGIVHAEMFPLLDRNAANPLELFQIWLNLPRADKMVAPYFSMQWNERIPRQSFVDDAGRATRITIIAGGVDGMRALPPPPSSWAARADADLAIWTLVMAPGARFTLPPASPGTNRTLYFFRGRGLKVGERELPHYVGVRLRAEVEAPLENGPDEGELLLLQGRPIGEPVAQYGPFVMNTQSELQQAFTDYRRTQFGGWTWPSDGPVHPRERGRFAIHADGTVEEMVAKP